MMILAPPVEYLIHLSKKAFDRLHCIFHFGTENGKDQLKKNSPQIRLGGRKWQNILEVKRKKWSVGKFLVSKQQGSLSS